MAKKLPNRCISEIEPRSRQNPCSFDLRLLPKSQELSPCASPSLKRVIKKNVVQMRREELEKTCQAEVLKTTGSLSRRVYEASRGRQVKSDSFIGLLSNQVIRIQGQQQLRNSENMDNFPSGARVTAQQEFDGISPSQRNQTMSCSVIPSESSTGTGVWSQHEKPQVQPKPSVMSKRFLSVGFPDAAGSGDTDTKSDSRLEFRRPLTSLDEVFPLSTTDTEKTPDGCNSKALVVPIESQKSIVHLRQDVTSGPTPPPKPPRNLSEVSPTSDERDYVSFPETDIEVNEGRYGRLSNAVSVVVPAVFPESKTSEKVTTPNTWIYPGTRQTPTYEEIGDVIPASTEIQKEAAKTKKEHKWGSKFIQMKQKKRKANHSKTIKFDNPSYGTAAESDIAIAGRPLVRLSSENVQNHLKDPPTKELVYDVPYLVTTPAESQDFNPVCFDEGGYAIPDVENTAIERKSQLKARSKVSHAYDILRLPNETGDATQIEDADGDQEEHKKHLLYVKSVRHYTSAAIAKYEQVKLKSAVRLFQYGMIIGLEDFKPKVLFCIPPEMQGNDSFICNFCFPDADMMEPMTEYEGELFSFVLTSETGDRRYGWCKRYLPPGVGPRLPEALCIVSPIGEFGMYEQLLRTLQEYRSHTMDCAVELIEVAYARPLPGPDKEVYIRTEIPNQGRQTIILKRASQSAVNTVPFTQLLERLPVSVLVQVFGAILMERKVVFCASRLSVLSSCICAMVALLRPFEWQHTFVTVLPTSLIDIVEAPTPFIVGILTSMKPLLEGLDISEVLLVDLDNSSILSEVGDESRIIPKKIQKALTIALTEESEGGVASDATVSEAFLRFFIETCSHYMEFIIRPEDDENTFQREQFVKAVNSRGVRLFLDWFTQTQMFEVFISGKLNQSASSGYFEDRIAEYHEEMEACGNKHKKKALRKKISEFFNRVIK